MSKLALASIAAFIAIGAGLFWYERRSSPALKAAAAGGNATSLAALDAGLDKQTLDAIHAALTQESNVSILTSFAQKLLAAGYVMSAAVITAKAQSLGTPVRAAYAPWSYA